MKINKQVQYVLDNLVNSWKCKTCHTMWIHFKDNKADGFYRLTDNPKLMCHKCREIDFRIEQKALMTSERWVSNEE